MEQACQRENTLGGSTAANTEGFTDPKATVGSILRPLWPQSGAQGMAPFVKWCQAEDGHAYLDFPFCRHGNLQCNSIAYGSVSSGMLKGSLPSKKIEVVSCPCVFE